jgi:hypothetical protein
MAKKETIKEVKKLTKDLEITIKRKEALKKQFSTVEKVNNQEK